MQLRPLDTTSDDDVRGFARVYETSFPENERLPLDLLLAGAGGRRLTVASSECAVIGLTSVLPHPSVGAVLLEYLAVDPTARSGGIGAALLDGVVADAGPHDVLAEIEPPLSSTDAERRAGFYARNGFEPAPWQGEYGMPTTDGGFVPLQLWHRAGHEIVCAPADLMRTVYTDTYADYGRPHLARILAGIHQG